MDKRIIDLKSKMCSLYFFLSCVYGNPIKARRRKVWNQLTLTGLSKDEAWLLLGDFNELMDSTEKLGGPLRNEFSFWDWLSIVSYVNCEALAT